jgi:hypothetical protein
VKKLFGLFEHLFFYGILIVLALAMLYDSINLVLVAIGFWFISFISHIMEHKIENRSVKKTIIGV